MVVSVTYAIGDRIIHIVTLANLSIYVISRKSGITGRKGANGMMIPGPKTFYIEKIITVAVRDGPTKGANGMQRLHVVPHIIEEVGMLLLQHLKLRGRVEPQERLLGRLEATYALTWSRPQR